VCRASALKPVARISACCGYQESFAAASTSGATERAYRGGESRYAVNRFYLSAEFFKKLGRSAIAERLCGSARSGYTARMKVLGIESSCDETLAGRDESFVASHGSLVACNESLNASNERLIA
jgi:hypothetical protein